MPFSVDFPGRTKLSCTPCFQAHSSTAFDVNLVPRSTRIERGNDRLHDTRPQDLCNELTGRPKTRFFQHTFPTQLIHNRQHPDRLPIRELIADKTHATALVQY